ncbi:MAG: IseA DL-endopeptidase inhibitor family protein, partial [Muribaculaceae bacterium]|nr:IseA DL-endopeptidase inhibitor family protein [Muribaculaceae bacterium]
ELPDSEKYLLREELDFLDDEQYDTYIRALIMLDRLYYFDVPSTSDEPAYFIDKYGEVSKSYTVQASDGNHTYRYRYVSTYQSFYEYLQSVFTEDAVGDVLSGAVVWGSYESFFKNGGELYCEFRKNTDNYGSMYFNGGEYNLIGKDEDEVVFEYTAHFSKDGNEWTETRPLRLACTDNGWRSECFCNLYVERNMPYRYKIDVDLSADYDYGREYEFDLDKYFERNPDNTKQYLLREELDFLDDEQYDTYIKAWIFIDNMDYANGSRLPVTNGVDGDWCYYIQASLISRYVSTYESFYEFLRTVFTKEAADEIVSGVNFYNADGELFYISGEAGGYLGRIEDKYELVEKTDSEVVFEYKARQFYDGGLYGYDDGTYIDITRTVKLVKEGDGWRAELFHHLIGLTNDELRELNRQRVV